MKWSTIMFILAAVFAGVAAYFVFQENTGRAILAALTGLFYDWVGCTVRRGGE
ncbi:hypothetical protein Psm1vBMR14_gp30c [Pseudomonas phage MR14]|nr:hypothetical protein Psm1vBMR14_gp30c [Pseudomonas phage MR14]